MIKPGETIVIIKDADKKPKTPRSLGNRPSSAPCRAGQWRP